MSLIADQESFTKRSIKWIMSNFANDQQFFIVNPATFIVDCLDHT